MKLIFTEKIYWKEKEHDLELYDAEEKEAEGLEPITQVQAIPFTEDGQVVLYKHIDGYSGLPGGGVEKGETFEQTLKREIYEHQKPKDKRNLLTHIFFDMMLGDQKVTYELKAAVKAIAKRIQQKLDTQKVFEQGEKRHETAVIAGDNTKSGSERPLEAVGAENNFRTAENSSATTQNDSSDTELGSLRTRQDSNPQ